MEQEKISSDHLTYLRQALDLARLSPPKPTNFRVGALLVNASTNTILATGYTLECPGNTHAEQSCFIKLSQAHNTSEERLADVLPEHTILYTTMEPCTKRLSGNVSCLERILKLSEGGKGIRQVVVGVKEPEKFVGENEGRRKLEDAGIEVLLVEGLEEEILKVATAGHVPE
ncbi:hypothetical protein MFRU_010g01910 [Monilinia fructicola]|nr:hypothetical protein MFRU_010g01910 [Monilinia fructicola]